MPPPGFCNNRISKGPRLGFLIIDEVGDSPRLMLVPLMYLTGNRSESNGTLRGKPTSIFSNICIITVDTKYMVLVIGHCRACDVGSNW